MAVNHYFHLQHFDKCYHLGKFIPDTRAYELLHNHELIIIIPAHYKNGLRFLNHIIICLQELLQHLGPSYHWDIIQLKYKAFGRELLVLSKIRQEFIQEVGNGYVFDQPEIHNTQWMLPIMDFFLTYMYYCGSVNPHYKSHMMSVALDDPQTYNRQINKRFLDCGEDYQSILQNTILSCLKPPELKLHLSLPQSLLENALKCDRKSKTEVLQFATTCLSFSQSKSEQEMPKSSVDVVENDVYDKAVKKG
ncbi:hypothetical protein F4604DRAFT_1687981 [Suillus subluteus]|nr:hypothetical protein F4604DRAFT_1687981 [Suillus subluteus]